MWFCDAVTVKSMAGNVVSGDYDNVVINGSFASWNGWGVTLTDEDGDGIDDWFYYCRGKYYS